MGFPQPPSLITALCLLGENKLTQVDPSEALQRLKQKKAARRAEYSERYRHQQRGEFGSTSRSTFNSGSSNLTSSTGTTNSTWDSQTGRRVAEIPATTWAKPAPKPRKKKPKPPPEPMPTPEPIERYVYILPAFDGKQKNLLTAEAARSLVLLHCLTSAISLSNGSAGNQIVTNHKKAFTISNKCYECKWLVNPLEPDQEL